MSSMQTERILERARLLDDSCGIGLWSALLVNGDAMHPDSVWEWSPEFRRLIGYDSAADFPDVVQSWSDRLHPDDVEATFAAFAGHLEDVTDRTRYCVDYRLKMRDGSYRWFRATGGCKHLEDGRIQACGSLSDVHEATLLQLRVEQEAKADSEAFARISECVAALAHGDLTTEIRADVPDKMRPMRDDFNAMVASLAELLGNVKATSKLMMSESQTISDNALELAKRGESQVASVEETAAAVEQISGNITTTSEGAREVDSAAKRAQERTDRGNEIVAKVVEAMSRIEAHTTQMSEITKVIESFAFQTNLLSINAAVEAARAGEVGRGFAVVAGEVRSLAQQSADASKRINDLIKQSEGDVREGVGLVQEAGTSLSEISESVRSVVQQISGIAHATSEQSIGVSEISSALNQIDGFTQKNLEISERYTASAQLLSSKLVDLSDMIQQFETADAAAKGQGGMPTHSAVA